ncbi:MAG TPA: hypothetical protein DCE44_22360 [Verrucomicrobiales bacterium]|nr:hypothetical protein [Verrucomicrobiales bacterium]
MDKESVTGRLREVAELSHLCRQLAGPRWPYRMSNLSRLLSPTDSHGPTAQPSERDPALPTSVNGPR